MFWPFVGVPTAKLDEVLSSPCLKGGHVGVCVTDGHGKVLYEKLSGERFVPASNQKLFSVLFALDSLGPDTRLKTKVWIDNGTIHIQGSSDPSLEINQFRELRKSLNLPTVKAVRAHLPFQTSLGPGWEWDDLPWYYAAPTSGLSVEHSAFDVFAANGKLEPLPKELRLKVARRPSKKKLQVKFEPATNTLTIVGKLPTNREKLGSFAQAAPVSVVARALGGEVIVDPNPVPSWPPDRVVEGLPMSLAAKECLEESDNMAAEQLMAATAIQNSPIEGSPYPFAAERMREFYVKALGISEDDFVPADGSGLSRHNWVTPRTVCSMLEWGLARPYSTVWLEALAAGGEGTLKNRLKDSTFIGKTGTMSAVVCLSGYVKTRDGSMLTLSILINNVQARSADVRSVQDRFVRILEEGTDPNG